MPSHLQSRYLPYTPAQLFGLVLDIERYPEFVPGYRGVCVTRREENALSVKQTVGYGPASITFCSRAEFETPGHIIIRASDGPFRRLEVEWRFIAEGSGCRVTAETRYRLHGLLAPLLAGWLELTAPRLLEAFARRAEQLFG